VIYIDIYNHNLFSSAIHCWAEIKVSIESGRTALFLYDTKEKLILFIPFSIL